MKTTVYILKDFHQYKKGDEAKFDNPIAAHLLRDGWVSAEKPKPKAKPKAKKDGDKS